MAADKPRPELPIGLGATAWCCLGAIDGSRP
jgi:hypothetical protein